MHSDKTSQNASQRTESATSVGMEKGRATEELNNHRPEVTAQLRLVSLAQQTPRNAQAIQLQAMADNYLLPQPPPVQLLANNSGLPDGLKSGIESLSGYSMDDVTVHRNSTKPAQLQAHAYAQGTDVHLGPGQEKHLPHEAWHVVQQKQGRVKPTLQMKGKVAINDDAGLEREADVMGGKALTFTGAPAHPSGAPASIANGTIQRAFWKRIDSKWVKVEETEEAATTGLPEEAEEGLYFDDIAGLLLTEEQFEARGEAEEKPQKQPVVLSLTAIDDMAYDPNLDVETLVREAVDQGDSDGQLAFDQDLAAIGNAGEYTINISCSAGSNHLASAAPVPLSFRILKLQPVLACTAPIAAFTFGETDGLPEAIRDVIDNGGSDGELVFQPGLDELLHAGSHVTQVTCAGSTNYLSCDIPLEVRFQIKKAPKPEEVKVLYAPAEFRKAGIEIGKLFKLSPPTCAEDWELRFGAVGVGKKKLATSIPLEPGLNKFQYCCFSKSPNYWDGNLVTIEFDMLYPSMPKAAQLMEMMGWVDCGKYFMKGIGSHGGLNIDFHLTIFKNCLGEVPDEVMYARGTLAIRDCLFPEKEGFSGLHVSAEVRQALNNGSHLNNAAYFLNQEEKYAKGYLKEENQAFIKACKKKLNAWWGSGSRSDISKAWPLKHK